jgi:hypothetical protein
LNLDYLSNFVYLARIDDNEPGFEQDHWMKTTKPTASVEELRADMDQLRDNPEQSGMFHLLSTVIIVIQHIVLTTLTAYAWTRAKERRFLTHRLCSRIRDDQPQGYAAFNWERILHGNAVELGDYKELAVLPDKIARYLYEYHADSYASHGLPVLPADRSRTNVHSILKPHQVDDFFSQHIVLILFITLTE